MPGKGNPALQKSPKLVFASSFNPRSCVGATVVEVAQRLHTIVSICAPAWGATMDKPPDVVSLLLFQSALPRGERRMSLSNPDQQRWFQSALPRGERRIASYSYKPNPCFNPRSRVGSDDLMAHTQQVELVSIRAPAWGATCVWICRISDRGFNPRSRVGSDRSCLGRGSIGRCFNPRSRVGSDKLPATRGLREVCFNPRSRVGSDTNTETLTPFAKVSIRAPAWGATACSVTTGFALQVSIRAPAWGATPGGRIACGSFVFQSALPRGERPKHGIRSLPKDSFNPRSRVGSDVKTTKQPIQWACFNPRSRVGSDVVPVTIYRKDKVSIRAPAWGATVFSVEV